MAALITYELMFNKRMNRQPTQLGNVAVSLLSTQPIRINVIDTNQMCI